MISKESKDLENLKDRKNNFKEKYKDFILNFFLVFLAFFLAVVVFLIFKNNEAEKEKNNLIPNAKSAYDSGNYSTSIYLFLKAENEFPNNMEVKEYLARLFYIKGKYEESINYYETVITNKDLNNEDIVLLGNAYLKLNKKEEAINLWKDRKLDPKNEYKLAKIYLENKNYDEYFAILDKLKDYKEPLVYLQIKENNLQNVLKNLEVARNLQALSSEDIDIDLFFNQLKEAKNQLDQGKNDYAELIQLVAFANINQCEFINQRITNLRNILESKKIPTYQVDFIAGKCANQRNDPDAAIPLINIAINADVSNIEYREELAKSYYLKKDVNSLKSIFEEIFNINKTSDSLQIYAGYLYNLGEKNSALEKFNEALIIAPTDAQKTAISSMIFQINFLDFTNLEICKNTQLVSLLDTKLIDGYFLKSHCDIFNSKPIDTAPEENLISDYIRVLSKKDRVGLEKVLDRDTEGFITTYYNAVGHKLMQ